MKARIARQHDGADLDTGRSTWDVCVGDKTIANTDTRRQAIATRDTFNAIASIVHWASHARRRYLVVVAVDGSDDNVHRVDVTGRGDRQVERTMLGMLRNMSPAFSVEDRIVIEPVAAKTC